MEFFKLKKVILKLFFLGITFPMYSQGGWNIKYNPLNNIESSFIGKQIALDIRSNEADTLKTNNFRIRSLLNKNSEDCIELSILGVNKVFKEDWNIYTDMGFIGDQFLENVENENIKIKEMFLLEIYDSKILVSAKLYNNNNQPESIEFEIEKKNIKGILSIK